MRIKTGSVALIVAACLGSRVLSAQVALQGHTDDVYFVAFLPDGKTLMSGAEDSSIRLWDVLEGKERGMWQQVPKFDAAPSTKILSLSADGQFLGRAGKAQGSVDVWSVSKVTNLRTIQAHQWPVYGVAISGNGAVLVSFSQDELKGCRVRATANRGETAEPVLVSGCGHHAGRQVRSSFVERQDDRSI